MFVGCRFCHIISVCEVNHAVIYTNAIESYLLAHDSIFLTLLETSDSTWNLIQFSVRPWFKIAASPKKWTLGQVTSVRGYYDPIVTILLVQLEKKTWKIYWSFPLWHNVRVCSGSLKSYRSFITVILRCWVCWSLMIGNVFRWLNCHSKLAPSI